ncbi:MAG: helix-turn-helix domain-containing protein [Verrucomicrobia bacterium]|nr:helix-turn-helix domain-containing protein [Verrucomicrobiota bacterium]
MVKALDAKEPKREASLLRVFRLYCVEGLSAEVTAQRCGCSKGTILNRLNQIRRRTGVDPAKLRTYSAQFEAIEESLSDDRARRIHRRSALDDPEEADDPGGF